LEITSYTILLLPLRLLVVMLLEYVACYSLHDALVLSVSTTTSLLLTSSLASLVYGEGQHLHAVDVGDSLLSSSWRSSE